MGPSGDPEWKRPALRQRPQGGPRAPGSRERLRANLGTGGVIHRGDGMRGEHSDEPPQATSRAWKTSWVADEAARSRQVSLPQGPGDERTPKEVSDSTTGRGSSPPPTATEPQAETVLRASGLLHDGRDRRGLSKGERLTPSESEVLVDRAQPVVQADLRARPEAWRGDDLRQHAPEAAVHGPPR